MEYGLARSTIANEFYLRLFSMKIQERKRSCCSYWVPMMMFIKNPPSRRDSLYCSILPLRTLRGKIDKRSPRRAKLEEQPVSRPWMSDNSNWWPLRTRVLLEAESSQFVTLQRENPPSVPWTLDRGLEFLIFNF